MLPSTKKLTVTAVSHADSGVITAFFNELPGLVVQGHSEEDVKGKLTDVLDSYINRLRKISSNLDIKTQSLV